MEKRKFFYDTEFMEAPGSLVLISIGVVNEKGDHTIYLCNADADLTKANDWVASNVVPKLPSIDEKNWVTMGEMRTRLLDYFRPSKESPVELWGYYSSYDHVLLCWIFGIMVDLPSGMPKLTLDLKQLAATLNVKVELECVNKHNALDDAKWNREYYQLIRSKAGLNNKKTESPVVCNACNDTHRVWHPDQERYFSCTACPLPCDNCRSGPYCEHIPCACECHKK